MVWTREGELNKPIATCPRCNGNLSRKDLIYDLRAYCCGHCGYIVGCEELRMLGLYIKEKTAQDVEQEIDKRLERII